MTDQPTFETKGASDIANIVDEMMRAFEAFKETNDRRLAELETTRGADALTTEKLMRLDRRLDELTLKAARPHLASPNVAPASPARREHKSAFDGYVRKGDASALVALEGKALSVQSSPDGGYLVPPETETAVLSALKAISPIRSIATIRQVSATVFKKPFSTTAAGTGWVGEIAARPETTTPTLAELQFPTMELYAMPAASPVLLDDAAVDVDSWLADEVRDSFAQQEGNAFVVGNGVNKPKGFLDYPKVAAASYTWGSVGFVATGVAGAFPAANPSDKLIDLVYATKSPYRANGTFVLNRSTMSVIRKFKDAQGLYIWQPSLTPGQPASLLGYPVVEAEDMPNIATDSYSLAFGDFRRGYLIVDRIGLRVLRDPYSSKPYVLFYTTKRVGGGIQDFDAIKLMKFGV
jgi:HK97 family phage major capsid protein